MLVVIKSASVLFVWSVLRCGDLRTRCHEPFCTIKSRATFKFYWGWVWMGMMSVCVCVCTCIKVFFILLALTVTLLFFPSLLYLAHPHTIPGKSFYWRLSEHIFRPVALCFWNTTEKTLTCPIPLKTLSDRSSIY